ncbi:glycosyltransferase family 4 protein [Citrobacter sedlakii]|uniref:glycosyltransferase family 4 protein n=1 Tax=Citrobacter sedlakii TaxID=67826 RepID=UPI0022B37B0C|nr:glycosyltransferase family 4 protein [Citrobacter sedlakii]MCZ4673876.1 glycosyltransferase family 4 protein [Citrobacter sedlakii]MDR5003932.1 glycosyltransferase family 4 protein [Citrobacter sedlakii]
MALEANRHILLVANTLWSVYNFRYGVIRSLIENGYKVTVVGPHDQYVQQLTEMGCNIELINLSPQGKNPFKDLCLIYELISIYKKLKPDFIFHYTIKLNIYGSIAAKLTNSKSIAITTGLGFVFNQDTILTKFISLLYSLAFRYSKEVWFLNNDDKAIFIKKNILKEDKAFILESEGVDTEYFAPAIKENSSVELTSGVTFLLIARMLWEKGVGEYVEAARRIKEKYADVRFQLLGACDSENPGAISSQEISNWHREGIIEYLGVTKDIRPFITNADCVVLPSFYREGVPRVLMEAASMAKPIITTDNVGCKDVIIDGQTGFLCKSRDANDLVKVMLEFIAAPQVDKLRMGDCGRELMKEKFDEKIIIDIYHRTLDKYLS